MTETPTATAPTPAAIKYCFSGSGKAANRKWAPGGDATYLSRLRKAHLAGESLPNPWYVQEHGGIEANAPEEGWPMMAAIDIAHALDNERGPTATPHWVHTLERAAASGADKAARRQAREEAAAERKAAREREKAAQAKRPKEGEVGEYNGAEATVLRRIDPERILISVNGADELVYDEEFVRTNAPDEAPVDDSASADEGEFVEQQ